MNFDSCIFLFAFLPVFLIINSIIRQNYRKYFLIVAGLVFYACADLSGVLVLLICACFNYLASTRVFENRVLLSFVVLFDVLILFLYKYLPFTVKVFSPDSVFSIVAPLGISFFIFKCISYVVDAYRIENNRASSFSECLLYISFFPQLVAGPISRFSDFKVNISSDIISDENIVNDKISMPAIVSGLKRFIIGFTKKVVFASTLEYMTTGAFGEGLEALDYRVAILGAVCYTLQIYVDFSGYSDMAIGLGQICGFNTLENFNFPYAAGNITDFWRRWHLSLSSWLRDYVYIPLGGNRKGAKRTALNKFIVFLVCGIWHGANWTFLLWGVWHGLLSGVESFFKGRSIKLFSTKLFHTKLFCVLGHIYMLASVCLGFVVFRAQTIQHGFMVISNCFGTNGKTVSGSVYLSRTVNGFTLLILALSVLFCVPSFVRIFAGDTQGYGLLTKSRSSFAGNIISVLIYLVLFVVSVSFMVAGGFSPFIYAQF